MKSDNFGQRVAEQRLNQAKLSFYLAFVMTTVCSALTIGGAVLVISGNVAPGTLITISSAVSSACCFKLAKEANDKLDKY